MSTGRPWMAWYPADIFNDPKYIVLSRSAKLTYRELLDRCWLAGAALPSDPRKLAALAGMSQAEFDADWAEMQDPADPCFITHPVMSEMLTSELLISQWREYSKTKRPYIPAWKFLRNTVFARDNFTCVYCGSSGGKLDCDHVIPISKGGDSSLGNLVASCPACNRSKKDRTPEEWRQ